MSKVRQCTIRSEKVTKTVWLDDRSDLKPGVRVTLKDTDEPKRLWDVLEVGRAHERSDIKRGWNNNI